MKRAPIGFKRLLVKARRLGGPLTLILSALGLLSAFTVHVAGYIIQFPRPLWVFIDAYFVSSLLIKFSMIVAISFLSSRYIPYIAEFFLGKIIGISIALALSLNRTGRRYIRIKGCVGLKNYLKHLLRAREDIFNTHETKIRKLFHSAPIRYIMGLSYVLGMGDGRSSFYIDLYSIPISIISVFIVMTTFYLTLTGTIIVVGAFIFLILVLPPTFRSLYLAKPYYLYGISPVSFFRMEPTDFFSIKKFVVILLTISFLLGYFHHDALRKEDYALSISERLDLEGNIMLSSSKGFVIFTPERSYFFLPAQVSFRDTMHPM